VRLAPAQVGEGWIWAGAILWHRREVTAARDRFASFDGSRAARTPFRTAELEALALCGLGQADRAEQHFRNALPKFALEDRYEPRALYDLLSDPPLSGIDRLRKVIDDTM
jgi:hypothetical protein